MVRLCSWSCYSCYVDSLVPLGIPVKHGECDCITVAGRVLPEGPCEAFGMHEYVTFRAFIEDEAISSPSAEPFHVAVVVGFSAGGWLGHGWGGGLHAAMTLLQIRPHRE